MNLLWICSLAMFLLLLLPETVITQNRRNIDSLRNLFSDTTRLSGIIDKNIIKAAIVLSDYYSRIRLDSAKYYGMVAYDLSEKLNNSIAKAVSLNSIGMSYTSAGYYDSATPYLDSALSLFEKNGDTTGITFVKNNLAVVSMRRGDYVKALEYYYQNLKNAKAVKHYENMLLAYNNMGIAYFDWKKYDDALDSYHHALDILDKTGEEERKGSVFNNIGEVYQDKDNLKKAKEYFVKSLEINKKYGKKRSILISMSSLGDVYFKEGAYQQALDNFREALKISKEIPDDVNVSLMNIKIGKTLNKKGIYSKAKKFLLKGLQVALQIGLQNNLTEAYEALIENAKNLHDVDALYNYTHKYISLKDSLFSEENMKTINELETRFKTAQKEKEIAVLTADQKAGELELQKQRNQKYFLIIALLLMLFTAYLLFNRYRIRQLKIKSQLEKAKISIEQRLLRSQMNPHFIFNSLNSINSFIGSNNPQEAQGYLAKFARLMRLILENSRKQSVALDDEVQALQLNLELEKLRFEDRFDFEISIAEEIDSEDIYISPMLVQPFIENAIKHGFKNKKDKGHIRVSFRKEESLLVCEVEDNGVGRSEAKKYKSKAERTHISLGTQVTKERFNAMKGGHSGAGFKIIDLIDPDGKPSGTKVVIKIPYEEE